LWISLWREGRNNRGRQASGKERLEAWLTYGPPGDCIAHLQRYAACRRITFRLSTMGDPMAQLRRLVEEVPPYV
jgi:hypothetical protein